MVGLAVPTARRGHDDEARWYFGVYGRALMEELDPARSRLAVSAARSAVPASDRVRLRRSAGHQGKDAVTTGAAGSP